MPESPSNEFAVLRVVAVKGRAPAAAVAVAECLGLSVEEVDQRFTDLVDRGLAKSTPGGLRVVGPGRERVAELVAAESAQVDRAAVAALYERFCELNDELKEIVTAWQLTDADTPNDHTDEAYDAAVVARLSALHDRARPVVAAVADLAPRLAPYSARLDSADRRIAAGDHSYVTKPIIDSYHTVWFELHEDLIGLAGLTRADEAAAGRGA
ncbi:hypothetical protein [Pseudonocardia pini]|uniref:hypothetical protein n=1 Tax=Pseudonocardia pini TaxID=2758030 RepID=UPI0015F0E5CC|nr:hypothetical protein [Pseudonocardia pini]